MAQSTLPNVGLTGSLRSGKDSVAAYLVRRYGYTRFAFGDELKRYAHELFDVPPDRKPRELYQWFGQTLRQRDPDVWVRKCFERIDIDQAYATAYSDVFQSVITDIRQPNEFTRCRSEGYVIIRVNAPVDVRLQRAIESGDVFSFADFRHETESHVDTFPVDYDVYNVGTLDELYAQIDAIINALRTEDDR